MIVDIKNKKVKGRIGKRNEGRGQREGWFELLEI